MEENTKRKLSESIGDYSSIFMETEQKMPFLEYFLHNAKLFKEVETEVVLEDSAPAVAKVFSLITDASRFPSEIPFMALIAQNKEKEKNEFVLFYPYLEGMESRVKVVEVLEWSNKLVATVEARYEFGGESFSFYFFATDYFANKDKYKAGNEIIVSLAGASQAEVAPKEFSFVGQQAIDFLKKSGREPIYDKDGNVEPVKFDLTKLVAYLPVFKDAPDIVEFQSPVIGIENKWNLYGKTVKTGIITLSNDPAFKAWVYMTGDCEPKEKDGVRGVLWLSGHLI